MLCCAAICSFAQKQSGPLPYNKQRLDSLFNQLPKLNQPFALPVPKGYSLPENRLPRKPKNFEGANPGATVINPTTKGIIYNMPLDNMAVLVPDMNQVERMPVANSRSGNYTDRMPNPLYHQKKPGTGIK